MVKNMSVIVGSLRIKYMKKGLDNGEGRIRRGCLWKELLLSEESGLLPPQGRGKMGRTTPTKPGKRGF